MELALFLTAASLTAGAQPTLIGALLGLAVAVLLGLLAFASTVRLDMQAFFRVTGFLLLLFSAGLVAHGIHELNEVGWIPALIAPVWDLNPVLDEGSVPGMLLKALFGYNGNALAHRGAGLRAVLRRGAAWPAGGRRPGQGPRGAGNRLDRAAQESKSGLAIHSGETAFLAFISCWAAAG